MEIIKRKILLDKNVSGNLKVSQNLKYYTFKIPLYQTIENLGLKTDISNNTLIYPCSSTIPLEFKSQGVISQWFKQGGKVVYASDSKLNEVKSYDKNQQFKINFDMKKEQYQNFKAENIVGVDRVTNIQLGRSAVADDRNKIITYVLDAKRDTDIGTPNQTIGTLYVDNSPDELFLPDELDNNITKTKVQYVSEGWNMTNSSLSTQIQEEYLLGIISPPEVKSDVFIDRSVFSVLDKHLRLSEIETLDHLTRYGNGFYNINRD